MTSGTKKHTGLSATVLGVTGEARTGAQCVGVTTTREMGSHSTGHPPHHTQATENVAITTGEGQGWGGIRYTLNRRTHPNH